MGTGGRGEGARAVRRRAEPRGGRGGRVGAPHGGRDERLVVKFFLFFLFFF